MSRDTIAQSGAVSARKLYLTTCNILFASLWASVFVKAFTNAQYGKSKLFAATEPQARWIQTASLIEVVHAATGNHFYNHSSSTFAHQFQASSSHQ
jgi:hypothetical protein